MSAHIRISGRLPFEARIELVEDDGRATLIPCDRISLDVFGGRPNFGDLTLTISPRHVKLEVLAALENVKLLTKGPEA